MNRVIRHFHLYCGSGGGAFGFQQAQARVGEEDGWVVRGDVGVSGGCAASWMETEEAERLIRRCFSDFRAGLIPVVLDGAEVAP